jgi:signal transduction histidine kinase
MAREERRLVREGNQMVAEGQRLVWEGQRWGRRRSELLGDGAPRLAVEAEVIPEDLALEVDPELFMLLLSNLVDDARRYGKEGLVTVRLQARRDGDAVVLEVGDDGPGLAVEAPGRLFEDLGRGRLEGAKGAGLGLTICRQVMELHRGQIALTSTSPRGTTFTLTLKAPPRRPRQGDDLEPRGAA